MPAWLCLEIQGLLPALATACACISAQRSALRTRLLGLVGFDGMRQEYARAEHSDHCRYDLNH